MLQTTKTHLTTSASVAAIAASLLVLGVPASAQSQPTETVIVTGIRASLESAIAVKRDAPQVMDAITAEDIGKFPDKDMGEALQRVTGVQITRSSGGEGSTVTIRGGDPGMTRVEINGTGALSVTPNAGDRAVDFRDLPVEFVNRLEVIKSPTADMIEGGLGGTVRVITRRPFDSTEPYLAGSAQVINANLPDKTDPRIALIGSKLFFGDTLGVLISGTWEKSHQADDQALTTGWLRQQKVVAAQGLPANKCGSYFGPSAPTTCGAGYTDLTNTLQGDWYPQIPRYFENRRSTMRYAMTGIVEYRPVEAFTAYIDTTFARGYENVRNAAIQLNANGGVFDYAKTTVGDDNTVNHIELTSNGWTVGSSCSTVNTNVGCLPLDLTYRTIDGYLTRQQLATAIGFKFDVTSEFTVDGRLDYARARVDNQETDVTATQYGVSRAIVDYTGSEHAPNIQLPGTDLTGATGSQTLEAYYTPVTDTTHANTSQLNVAYKPHWADWLQVKAGYRRSDLLLRQDAWGHRVMLDCRGTTASSNRIVINYGVGNCSGLQTILSNTATATRPFFSTGKLGFSDEARSWAFLGPKVADAILAKAQTDGTVVGSGIYDIYDLNAVNPNDNTQSSFKTWASNWTVGEGTTDWYGMASFDFPEFYFPVSGNVGLRYVDTNTSTTGYSTDTVKFKAGSTTLPDLSNTVCPKTSTNVTANAGSGGSCTVYNVSTIRGGYTQSLPSANLKVDFIPDHLILRLAYGKVMAPPSPSQMSFGRTLDVIGHTGKQGNPGLLPYLSADYDVGLEWYFGKLNAITVGLFQKNISRFITSTTSTLVIDTESYAMTMPVNGTDKVRINGIEVGAQYMFDWLPSPFDGIGVTANMTMQQDHGYKVTNVFDGTALTFPGLSKQAENASIFYENDTISARLSYVWRAKWLITPTGRGNLPEFNDSYGELDASASYNLYEGIQVFADAVNLTDSQLVQRNAPARPILFDTFGRRLYFGVRAKY